MTGERLDKQSGLGYNMDMSKEVKKYLSEIGKRGGSVKSERKTHASRINGRKGGRPKEKKVSEMFRNKTID